MRRYQVEIPSNDYWRRQINCQDACPVHTDARGYVRAIAEGRFEEAYLIARGPNPLASICGRVCGAPCEASCRRGKVDEAISIRALKRFACDQFDRSAADRSPPGLIRRLLTHSDRRACSGAEELASLRELLSGLKRSGDPSGPKVAIVGAGPAGLAAAHDLALLGFRPTVFEVEPIPAGMLAVGIPQYRLPRDLIAAEVEFIRRLGVEFLCNTRVGEDISLGRIREEHEATIIAVGLKQSAQLELPGSSGPGVLGGIEFLRDVALRQSTEIQGDVVVIGGGNVAYDVARTVIRQTGVDVSRTALRQSRVRSVHLSCLESLEEMPADDVEIIEGDEEGVVRHHSVGPKEIVRDSAGRVRAVLLKRCLRMFDDQGRFAPKFDEQDVIRIEANTVIWAIGQRAELSLLDSESDIERTERGLIRHDGETLQTTAEDVFVAGDAAYGPKMLIDAVASGKRVAREIHCRLRGAPLNSTTTLVHIDLPAYRRERDYEKLDRTEIPTRRPAERRSDQETLVEIGFGESQAVREGCRCLDCGVNTIFDSAKCILCGGCADVCPESCLELVSVDRLAGGADLEKLLSERTRPESPGGYSAIVKDETKCIRCALCAERCPVGAITMERLGFSGQWLPGAVSGESA